MRGGNEVKIAVVHIPPTIILILLILTLCCLALVMQYTTHALSMEMAVMDQMTAIPDITEMAPYS